MLRRIKNADLFGDIWPYSDVFKLHYGYFTKKFCKNLRIHFLQDRATSAIPATQFWRFRRIDMVLEKQKSLLMF